MEDNLSNEYSGKDTKIRYARLDDASAICNIHRSHIDSWYRLFDGKRYETGYESMTLSERCGTGGPWMSVETCSIHLNNLILRRHYPIVFEHRGSLLGEMELFISREGSTFGKNAHIGLLYVKKGHTRKGIGRALVDKAIDIARENACDTVTVSSGMSTEGFYESCGFKKTSALGEVRIKTRDHDVDIRSLKAPVNIQSFVWGKEMRPGRYQSSAYHIFEMHDNIALPVYANISRQNIYYEVNGKSSAVSCLTYDTTPPKTIFFGWTDGATLAEMLLSSLTILHKRGVETAHTIMTMEEHESISDKIESDVTGLRSMMLYRL
ncbi:N-acetyltransferase [Methanocella sp. CWC-04]|uniref:N-acetyltransferase n=1 Tax=Methanooceanicella nereidis TaxID=2052831 RepID=A0AAP2RCY4_9EURY|nr:GNAT family N-acetyltransferase [Methanocella sp. CWC-04]MCD1295249.1 N-acetyltransferase [Methanocella sp. CWC-04]